MMKRPHNINADAMETNPVNKACITATNDVIVPKLQDSTYSSSLSIAGFDIFISAIFARFDKLIFAFKWRDSAYSSSL